MTQPTVRILVGDVRACLREQVDAESVHCCVTSPPYFGGVRSYGTAEQIWGGSPECDHAWDAVSVRNNGSGGKTPKQMTNAGSYSSAEGFRTSAFCSRCQAWKGELGAEPTPALYVAHLVEVCDEIWRVLHPTGTFWLNLGDVFCSQGGTKGRGSNSSISAKTAGSQDRDQRRVLPGDGLKRGDLCLAPHRVAIALQERGWWVRMDCVWAKGRSGEVEEDGPGSVMPHPVTDRPHRSHEYVFLLTKSEDVFYDHWAVREEAAYPLAVDAKKGSFNGKSGTDGLTETAFRSLSGTRNLRSVWNISSGQYQGTHTATFPLDLPLLCLTAGTSRHGACASCGAQWEPVITKGEVLAAQQRACGANGNGSYHGQDRKDYAAGKAQTPAGVKARTLAGMVAKNVTGWRPTCKCGTEEVVPPTVLDPFSGSGTSGVAARQLGCSYLGCELNPQEARDSERRIEIEGAGRRMRFGRRVAGEQGALAGLFGE
jgi:DNA modification methylase